MPAKTIEINLKEEFSKKFNAKPGDHLEIIVKKNGKAVIKKKNNSIIQQTFGIWKDEVEGIKYMDKMRKLWNR